jgi:hypothetical protein
MHQPPLWPQERRFRYDQGIKKTCVHPYRHHARAKSLFDVVPARKGDRQEQKPNGPTPGRNQNDGGLSK